MNKPDNIPKPGEVECSVIVPVYNSELSLEELFLRTKATFTEMNRTFEMIFVEDAGKDNSWAVLEKLKKQYPETITAIKLAKNFGQHNAIFCGLHFINGKYIVTIDDDLQIPPEEIKKLILKYEEDSFDVVYGDLVRKEHSLLRNFGSRIMKKSSKKLDEQAPGKGSSFKLFSRDIADKLLLHYQNFMYIDELILWYTKDIGFVLVQHEKRKYQESTYTFYKLFRLFINITIYYTVVPLKFMTYGGLILSAISFIIGINFIVRKIFFNVPLGYTSIIVTILFSSSTILFSLGVIGEYLNRIFQVQNKKPPFSIKKIL
jgi:glycosyltransferase involved in cell wall biosynthesis